MNTAHLKTTILLLSLVCLLSCKKEDIDNSGPQTPQTPASITPAPDSIADITKDFAFAVLCITDVDQMMGMLTDYQLSNQFYLTEPGTGSTLTGTTTVLHDPTYQLMVISYNQTRCMDGKRRDGSVFMDYQYQNFVTPPRYREPAFTAKITFSNYKVDGWLLNLADAAAGAVITNNTPVNFNPGQTNLSWTISGKFNLYHPTDPNRDLVLEGTLLKTLSNTSDTNVYSPSLKIINWNLAKTRFTGIITGTRGGSNNYTYTIDSSYPLERNFACAISPSTFTQSTQFHPIISGATTLSLSGKSTQYTNHNNNMNSTTPACDNTGSVKVNGKTYSIDF